MTEKVKLVQDRKTRQDGMAGSVWSALLVVIAAALPSVIAGKWALFVQRTLDLWLWQNFHTCRQSHCMAGAA